MNARQLVGREVPATATGFSRFAVFDGERPEGDAARRQVPSPASAVRPLPTVRATRDADTDAAPQGSGR